MGVRTVSLETVPIVNDLIGLTKLNSETLVSRSALALYC